jgi:hypothetical protein
MTPFDAWVTETAAAMVKPTEEEWSESRCQTCADPDWAALRLRFAIALVQARALECRQIGGGLLIKQPGTLKEIADGLSDRSHKLEQLGLRMAAGNWPEEEEVLGPRLVQ